MAKKKASTGTGIPVAELSEALSFVRGFTASDKSAAGDDSRRILYFSSDGVVRAHSGATAAERRLPLSIGDFAAPADRVLAAVATVAAQGVAEIEFTVDGAVLAWRGGSARGRVPCYVEPLSGFPVAPDEWTPLEQGFWVAVQRAQYVVSKSDQWPMLRGVYSDGDSVLASDASRFVCVAGAAAPRVLIPDHLLRALRGFTPKETRVVNNLVWFRNETSTVCGRLMEHEFPGDRIKALFKQFSTQAEKGDFTRVAVKEGQPTRALLKSVVDASEAPMHAVRVAVGKRAVEVTSEDGTGESRVLLAADVAGEAVECRINAQFLAELVDQGTPLYFTPQTVYAATDDRAFQAGAMCFAG